MMATLTFSELKIRLIVTNNIIKPELRISTG